MLIAASPFKRSGLALVLVSPLFVGVPQPQTTVSLPGHESTRVATPSQNRDLQSLPLPAQASISAVLGRNNRSYHALPHGMGVHTENPNHELAADFTPQGVELRAGAARWGIALRGYGYGEALNPVSAVSPEANANRVEYRRGALTEWYENGPLGLEQGFTLDAPPGPRPSGVLLTLELGLSGDVQPTLDANGAMLTLQQADGTAALRYAGLSAYDSDGRELPVTLEMQGELQLRLRVNDAGARYPLLIDPLVQTETGKAKLVASDGAVDFSAQGFLADDSFGDSVAIDGQTIVVGAPFGGNDNQGSAYVFVQPRRGWFGRLTQTAKLTASDGFRGDIFGGSVAIDGDTIVVGAASAKANGHRGSAYVFGEPAGGWGGTLKETARLTASDGAPLDMFGVSVAISGDTVVVGAHADAGGQGSAHVFAQGSAYVFVEPEGGWGGHLNETAKLTASDGAAQDMFGVVAISGQTVVVGASGHDIGGNDAQGSAYVFVQPAGGWGSNLHETAKLRARDGAPGDVFGVVAISGQTIVVGAPGRDVGGNVHQGSAYVFVQPAGGWGGTLNETARLTASDGLKSDFFSRVAISGQTIVVGATGHHIGGNVNQGSAYVFVRPAGGWGGNLHETGRLTASDGAPGDEFGRSVAIDGDTVMAGAPRDDRKGSAYVFVLDP